jgi:thymidylate synthase (FAD)
MKVKLISYTKPSDELIDSNVLTEDEKDNLKYIVAFCARVSNPNNQNNKDTVDKLINYLLKHKHFSPFEMVNICLEIETTRDIARQILRHRSFTFQEFSQRYADPTKDLSFVTREARLQDTSNRQNSIENCDATLEDQWFLRQQEILNLVTDTYKWAIENGIAKEQARVVLPEGLTVSRMYMNGTLRSWIHYCALRAAEGTQKEHRLVAIECAKVITELFPQFNTIISGE